MRKSNKVRRYLITFEVGSITMRVQDAERHLIHEQAMRIAVNNPELGAEGKILKFERV